MAADTVQIELTANDAKAVAAWQRQRDNIESFEKQLDKTANKSKSVGESNVGMGEKALLGMGKSITAMLGVGSIVAGWQTAISLMTAEINNAIDRQKDAAVAQMKMPEVYEMIRDNMGDDTAWGKTPEEREKNTEKKMIELAAATGKDPDVAARTFAQVQSAKAATDDSNDVYEATVLALKSNPASPSNAKELAASALDLRGGNDQKTIKGQMGIIQATGAMSRIESLSDVGKTLAPVNAAVQQSGGDIKFSQALVGMISNALVDKTGDQTRTTGINLVNDIMSAAPGAKDPLEALGVVTKKGQAFAKDKTEFEKLESNHLRDKEQERRFNELKTLHHDFLGIADKGEAAAKPMRRSLFSGGDQYQKLMTNLNDKAVDEAGGERVFDEKQRAIGANTSQNIADVKQAGSAAVESLKQVDPNEAMQSVVREIKADLAKAIGDSAAEQKANEAIDWVSSWVTSPTAAESTQSLISDVQQRAAVLREPVLNDYTGEVVQPSNAELQKAAVLESFLPRLFETLEKINKNLDNPTPVKVKNSGPDPRFGPSPRPTSEMARGGT